MAATFRSRCPSAIASRLTTVPVRTTIPGRCAPSSGPSGSGVREQWTVGISGFLSPRPRKAYATSSAEDGERPARAGCVPALPGPRVGLSPCALSGLLSSLLPRCRHRGGIEVAAPHETPPRGAVASPHTDDCVRGAGMGARRVSVDARPANTGAPPRGGVQRGQCCWQATSTGWYSQVARAGREKERP